MRNILITGGTGFLGSYILHELLKDGDNYVYVLARGKGGATAKARVDNILNSFYGNNIPDNISERFTTIEGDIENSSLGLTADTAKRLSGVVDEIYHSAALAEFRVSIDKVRKANVTGTKNLLDFALECRKRGRDICVNHISTAYVAGNMKGIFYEKDLDVRQGFNNTYEKSKFEAEQLVKAYSEGGLKVRIFRPSIITGDSLTGNTTSFKMFYQPLHFFAAELFERAPGNRNNCANLIPVDWAAKIIHDIANKKDGYGHTFHVVGQSSVKVGYFFDLASDFFGFKKIDFVPLGEFDMSTLTYAQRMLLDPFIPYFNSSPLFDLKNTKSALGADGLSAFSLSEDHIIRLFEFCDNSGFIRRVRRHAVAG